MGRAANGKFTFAQLAGFYTHLPVFHQYLQKTHPNQHRHSGCVVGPVRDMAGGEFQGPGGEVGEGAGFGTCA